MASSGVRAALCVVLLGALFGCAAWRPTQTVLAPAELTRFELAGRINLRVEKEGFPGRVRWRHAPDEDELWFYSPIGSTVAHMRQDAGGATLVTAEGHEYHAADLHQLALEVLGWDLPLDALQYWVRGTLWPGTQASDVERDEQGRLKRLDQAGWEVSYLDWKPAGVAGLPSKLDVQGQRLRMRLAVDQWKVDGAASAEASAR